MFCIWTNNNRFLITVKNIVYYRFIYLILTKSLVILAISQPIKNMILYFNSLPERFDLFYSVEKGTYVTGSIKHVYLALQELKDDLLFDSQTFIDAGSGDGRICAIASLMGLESYGIEYNGDVAQASFENIQQLKNMGIFTNGVAPPKIVQGDFLEESTYQKLGIEFSNINIIFNFVTYHENLADKIVQQSPKGTIFILHSPCPISFSPKGMDLVKEIPLTGIYHVLYVYRKN